MREDGNGWQICAQTHDRLGESILWHPVERALYWVDYYGPFVRRQKSVMGPVETWSIGQCVIIGSLAFSRLGLLLAMDHGLHLFDLRTGDLRRYSDPKAGRMDLAYNDSKVDRRGRCWVGTLALNETDAIGGFYRLLPDGGSVIADEGFVICNGPAFSPDNQKLYFSDSVGRRILRYELADDGSLSNRCVLRQFAIEDGMPDGLTVDSLGNIWCAIYGGGKVVCLDTSGVTIRSIPIPAAYPTSLCLGGPGFRTLFVTTGVDTEMRGNGNSTQGGSVFMRQVEIPGLPEPVMSLA